MGCETVSHAAHRSSHLDGLARLLQPMLRGMDCPNPRPLRILQVSPYFAQAWGYGGIPRVVTALTYELARRGCQVTVCTTDAADRAARLSRAGGPRLSPWPASPTAPHVEVRVFPNLSNAL